ncbi:MAG: tetratricopeptide repeat protein [Gemmatimonadetes bacterium]|nr:tetratricopeptide repeat protein [Gemmatimonadota bacterium]
MPALGWLGAGLLAACADSETPLARGDRLWADSAFPAALAEYRLSYARSGSVEALARVAHGYAVTGQFERSRESYDELLRRAPEYTDQAAFDYLDLAERAQQRSDRYGMAGAVEAALALRPGLPVEDMTMTLARYYAGTGAVDRAVEYYDRALATAPADSVAGLLYELAGVQQARGNCRQAVELLSAFRERVPETDPRSEQARYTIGSCAWQMARTAIAAEPVRALALLETVNQLGIPATVQAEAWFERGEILLGQGRNQEALGAYLQALQQARTPRGQLAERARQRIDELRFGRRPGGPGAEPESTGPGTHNRTRT